MINVDATFAPLESNQVAIYAAEDVWRPLTPVPSDAPRLTKHILERLAPRGYMLTAGWRGCWAVPFALIDLRMVG